MHDFNRLRRIDDELKLLVHLLKARYFHVNVELFTWQFHYLFFGYQDVYHDYCSLTQKYPHPFSVMSICFNLPNIISHYPYSTILYPKYQLLSSSLSFSIHHIYPCIYWSQPVYWKWHHSFFIRLCLYPPPISLVKPISPIHFLSVAESHLTYFESLIVYQEIVCFHSWDTYYPSVFYSFHL